MHNQDARLERKINDPRALNCSARLSTCTSYEIGNDCKSATLLKSKVRISCSSLRVIHPQLSLRGTFNATFRQSPKHCTSLLRG